MQHVHCCGENKNLDLLKSPKPAIGDIRIIAGHEGAFGVLFWLQALETGECIFVELSLSMSRKQLKEKVSGLFLHFFHLQRNGLFRSLLLAAK